MLIKSVNRKLGTEDLSGLTATELCEITWGHFKFKKTKSTAPGTRDCSDVTLQRGELGTEIPKYHSDTTEITSGAQTSPQPQGQWLQ